MAIVVKISNYFKFGSVWHETMLKCIILILLVLTPTWVLAALKFTPRIEISQSYTDNVELSPRDEESEHVTQINPGFSLTNLKSRYKFSVEYDLENLFFWNDSDRNEV